MQHTELLSHSAKIPDLIRTSGTVCVLFTHSPRDQSEFPLGDPFPPKFQRCGRPIISSELICRLNFLALQDPKDPEK